MKRSFTMTLSLLATVSVLAAGVAAAETQPKTLNKVDPMAPCFQWPAVDYDGDGVWDRVDYCPGTPKGCTVNEWGCSTDSDQDGVCDQLDLCPNTPKGEKVNKQGCSESQTATAAPARTAPEPARTEPAKPAPPAPAPPPPAPRSEVERKLVETGTVRLENVLFETNSAKLLPESQRILDEAGEALAKYPELQVEIGGHTDTRGAAAANLRLSQARAEAVRSYLLAHYSLRAANLTARGYGETQPLNRERTAAELRENRRVELKVLNPGALPGGVKIQN